MSGQINLFNPIFLQQKKHFSAVTMVQALALIIAGALVLTFYMKRQLAIQSSQAATTAATLALKQARLAKVNADFAVKPKSAALEAQASALQAELANLQGVAALLQKGEFGNRSGFSAYMQAFARQTRDGLWLTGFTIAGNGSELAVSGGALQAEQVPAFIGRLGRESVMHGASFGALDIHRAAASASAAASADAAARAPDHLEFSVQSAPQKRAEPAPAEVK